MSVHVYIDRTNSGVVFYVGKGRQRRVELNERNRKHQRVAKKHGMQREVVATLPTDEAACDLEIQLIGEHHTFVDDPLAGRLACNFTRGGDGIQLSRETRARMSRARTGKKLTATHRAKISAGREGMKFSDEHRANIGRVQKGRRLSEEHRAKISASGKGMRRSDTTRKRISEGRKGMKFSDEHRQRLSVAHRGVRLSEAAKAKLSVPVEQLDAVTMLVIRRFPSVKAAAESMGVTSAAIQAALRANSRCKGYRWRRVCDDLLKR